jgi:hypothetical protein
MVEVEEELERLQDEATAVDCEIQEIQESCRVGSAAERPALERRLDFLTVKRASLTKAMVLVSSVDDAVFAKKTAGVRGPTAAQVPQPRVAAQGD